MRQIFLEIYLSLYSRGLREASQVHWFKGGRNERKHQSSRPCTAPGSVAPGAPSLPARLSGIDRSGLPIRLCFFAVLPLVVFVQCTYTPNILSQL